MIEMNRSGESPVQGAVRPLSNRTGIARQFTRKMLTAILALALLGAPSVGFAGEAARETGREGGLGAAAALSSLVYAPVKLLYATGGLIVGSFAWAFTAGDTEVAEKVFTRSLRGHYVVTPDHLTGERELVFIGRDVAGTSTGNTAHVASAAPVTTEPAQQPDYDEMGW